MIMTDPGMGQHHLGRLGPRVYSETRNHLDSLSALEFYGPARKTTLIREELNQSDVNVCGT